MASTWASVASGLMPPSSFAGIHSVTRSSSESLLLREATIPNSIAPNVLVTENTWYVSVEPPGEPPSQQSLPWRIRTNGVCTNFGSAASSTSGSRPHSAAIRSRGTCCQSAVPGSCAPAAAGNEPAASAAAVSVTRRRPPLMRPEDTPSSGKVCQPPSARPCA